VVVTIDTDLVQARSIYSAAGHYEDKEFVVAKAMRLAPLTIDDLQLLEQHLDLPEGTIYDAGLPDFSGVDHNRPVY
jgi:hypothetical protein